MLWLQTCLLLCSVYSIGSEIFTLDILPKDVEPLHYRVNITTELGPGRSSFKGIAIITLKVNAETRSVSLHAKDLIIYNKIWLIRKLTELRISINSTIWQRSIDRFKIEFNNRLWLGEIYNLRLFFSGKLSRNKSSTFYKVPYNKLRNWYALTRLEPYKMRSVFPCFDEPDIKAIYTLVLGHHRNYTAVSNMPIKVIESHDSLDNFTYTVFEDSLPLSTHMLSWCIHQLEHKSLAEQPTNISLWGRKQYLEKSSSVLLLSSDLLKMSTELIGLPNNTANLRKLDQLALPNYDYAAVAYWGLIVYSESVILQDQSSMTLAAKQHLTELVTQQFLRQWHGNIIDMKELPGEILSNGLTKFLAIELVSKRVPEWIYRKKELLSNTFEVMYHDGLDPLEPLEYTKIDGNVQELQILIKKMSCFFNMLQAALGKKVFYQGLQDYWKQNTYKYVNLTQFQTALQQNVQRSHALPQGISIRELMKSWTQLTGYPLLRVEQNDEEATVTISQDFYQLNMDNTNSSNLTDPCWVLPISYTTLGALDFNSTRPHEWLSCELTNLTLRNVVVGPNEWILFNIEMTQLHRTLYDEHNWRLLAQFLASERYLEIPMENRAQLIDDGLSLAWSDLLSYEEALGLVSYIKQEKSYIVWHVAMNSLEKLNNIMRATSGYRIFRLYMQGLIQPQFDAFNDSSVAEHPNSTTLIYRMACLYEIPACIKYAQERFSTDNRDAIKVELREIIYCIGVRLGLEQDWTQLYYLYKQSKLENERLVLLRGMACSTEEWALGKLLHWTFNMTILTKPTALDLFGAVVRNPLGYYLARQHLASKIDLLKKLNDTQFVLELLQHFAACVFNEKELQNLKQFMSELLPNSTAHQQQQLLALPLGNIQWRMRNYYKLLQAIRDLKQPQSTLPTDYNPTKTTTALMEATLIDF